MSDVIPSKPTIPSEDAVRQGQTLKTIHLATGEESATAERLIHLLEIQENRKQQEREDVAKRKRVREEKSNNNSALGRDLIARVKSGGKNIKQLKLDELKLISLALGHTIVVDEGKAHVTRDNLREQLRAKYPNELNFTQSNQIDRTVDTEIDSVTP